MVSPTNFTEMSLLLRVREQTRALHEQLETQLPFDDALTIGRYQELLAKFWGIFHPLELALAKLNLHDGLDVQKRQRSALLLRDLAATGLTQSQVAALPRCQQLPELSTEAAGLGCLYVLEGSRLGGQYVSKLVLQRLQLTEHAGCSFFSSDGAAVGPMWRSFCDVVRERVIADSEQQEFVTAAQSTFSAFVGWLGSNNAKLV
jgi:heme oxygenase (biliverdin-IX-beta and delta-forming)